MEFKTHLNYGNLTDRELVTLILTWPHDEEAAVVLLYDRYRPMLMKLYSDMARDRSWYDDFMQELFIHLKGSHADWQPLTTFGWRSSFGTWLKDVARNKLLDLLPRLIENPEITVSVDDDDPDKPPVRLPDDGEAEYERNRRKVLLMEAIGQLPDEDQRFVILRRLQGYDSRETAVLLRKRWQRHGIVKYNNRHEPVVPDAAYVDVRTQRAKAALRTLLAGLL